LRTWLLGLFAAVATLLSAIGIYGVFAHAVVRRTREVGVRAALGAGHRQLVWLVLREGMVLTGAGLAAGFVGALAVSQLLRTFLFGVEAIDPLAIGVTAVTLAAVATVACYIPARRTSMIDPVTALHAE
jgi:ABC-type antimicrobial peptide transport system permease subunit